MTSKCTSMNVCKTFSEKNNKKQIDFRAETSMFPDLTSRMKSLHSTSENLFAYSRENFPILGFSTKVIRQWPFSKSGDR